MLKFINLKRLTAKALIGILVVGGLVAESSNKKAFATNSCPGGNNGHGNNAPYTHYLDSGKLTIGHYDPSNPGVVEDRLIDDLDAGLKTGQLHSNRPYEISYVGYDGSTSYDLTEDEAEDIVESHPDWEIKGNENSSTELKAGCGDQDNDGIDDAIEVGSNFNNPIDTDGDGIPNYLDTDSDGDSILDSVEGIIDRDGDNIADYLDAVDDSVNSVSNDDSDTNSSTPTSLILTGTIRDFQASHPDFESTTGNDRNIVTLDLGIDKKPVYADHPNDSTRTTNGKANFDQWYRDVPGINKSKEHSIELTLQDDGTYKYQNNQFFPINGELWGNFRDNKNYHFTYELHTEFTYKGGEVFTFSGDDDVFVYIDGKRVIDIGGVHTSQTDSVSLDSLGLTVGETYDLDFFFAERHYSQSNFTITTSIELETSVNPDADDDNDGIPNIVEGSEQTPTTDSDGDGTPDYEDEDSDNNEIPDSTEVGIPASPSDSDGDGTPNYQDDDDDGNGILDVDEIGSNPNNPTNTDGTDLPDYQDTDDDNDGILDVDEIGSDPNNPTNTDGTDLPDYQDTDSDNDSIPDVEEGDGDFDGDNTPNYQDEDSDGDTIPDLIETSDDSSFDDDTDPNFLDLDSDGDGIPDENEDNADSNDEDEESDVEEGDLPEGGTIENVDDDDDDNYLDPDSDDDGFPDNVDPEPYIPTYAD